MILHTGEYRSSLKHPDAEEMIDLIFFRPVSFILVKMIYRLPISPNQVSILSLAAGLAAAFFISSGEPAYFRVGGILLLIANLFDCMDGQLARLQGSGTFFGRVIDGIADYITGVAVFFALGIGLKSNLIWILVIGVGVSSIIHGIAFDYYQGEFLKARTGKNNISANEVKNYLINNLKTTGGLGIRRIIGEIYLLYLNLQDKAISFFTPAKYQLDEFQKNDERIIRLWSFLGTSTNRSMLMIFCFIGLTVYYLFIVIVCFNLLFIFCLFYQRRISKLRGNDMK